jgi:hypothetical protein
MSVHKTAWNPCKREKPYKKRGANRRRHGSSFISQFFIYNQFHFAKNSFQIRNTPRLNFERAPKPKRLKKFALIYSRLELFYRKMGIAN